MSAPTGPQPSIHTPDTRMQPFLGASPGASIAAFRRGLQSVGAEDNTFLLFSDLVDSASVTFRPARALNQEP